MRQFFFCMILLVSLDISAQTTQTPKSKKTDWGMGLQVNVYDFSRSNKTLGDLGYPDLEPGVPGGTFFYRTPFLKSKRWVSEQAFDYLQTSANGYSTASGRDVNFRDFAYTLRAMYDLLPNKKLTKIYPYMGLSARYQRMRIYDGLPRNGTISSALNGDLTSILLTQTPVGFEVGFSLEQGINLSGTGYFVGIRGGVMGMLQSDWKLNGDYIIDLDRPTPIVPYLTFLFRFKEFGASN